MEVHLDLVLNDEWARLYIGGHTPDYHYLSIPRIIGDRHAWGKRVCLWEGRHLGGVVVL
jgi:hypothetical protein